MMIKKFRFSLILPFITSLLILFSTSILYTKASSLVVSPSTINIALSNIPQNTQRLVVKLNYDPAIINLTAASPSSGAAVIDPISKAVGVISLSTALPENLTITLVFNGLQFGSSNISIDSITDTLGGQVISGVNSAISTSNISVAEATPTPIPTPTPSTTLPDPGSLPNLIPSGVELTISNIPSGSKEISVDIFFEKLILIIKNGASSTLSSIKASVSQPFSSTSPHYDYQTIKITNASSDLPESVSVKLSLAGITFGATLLSINKMLINGRESSTRNASIDQNYVQVYRPNSSPYTASTPTPTPSPITSLLDQSLHAPKLGAFFSTLTNNNTNEEVNLLKGSNTSLEFSGYNALEAQSVDYLYSDSRLVAMINTEIIKDTDLSLSLIDVNIPSDASDDSTLRFNLANGETKEFTIMTISPLPLQAISGKKTTLVNNPVIDNIEISRLKDFHIFKVSGSNFIADKRLFYLNETNSKITINNRRFAANVVSISPEFAMAGIGSVNVSPDGKLMLIKVSRLSGSLDGFLNINTPTGAYSKKFSIND